MKANLGAYYPPRARWYNRRRMPWHRLRATFDRIFNQPRIQDRDYPPLSAIAGFIDLLISFPIPGHGFRAWRPWLGSTLLAGYALLLFFFLVAFGTILAKIAIGLMLGIHCAGILYAWENWAGKFTWRKRIVLALVVPAAMWFLVYHPLLNKLQAFLVRPVPSKTHSPGIKSFLAPDIRQPVRRGLRSPRLFSAPKSMPGPRLAARGSVG
jgi:hypothetical protein